MSGLFSPVQANRDATDGERQTITQTVKAFLKWNPLKDLLDKISSHPLMVKDENTQGMVPPYCISPGVSPMEGVALLLWYGHS